MKIMFQFVFLLLILSCNNNSNMIITIQNTLNTNRSFETVTINLESQNLTVDKKSFFIEDIETGEKLISQVIDEDNDGKFDFVST